MILEKQIRERLGRFLRKELSLDQFEDWFVQQSWNMHRDSDEAAQKLASAIELRLSEHSSGHLDDASLIEELRQFLNPPVVQVSFGPPQPQSVEKLANNVNVVSRAMSVAFSSPAGAVLQSQGGSFLAGVVSFGRGQLVAHE